MAHIQACARCGVTYEAHTSKSRFCTGACRAQSGRDADRAARRDAGRVLLLDMASAVLDRQLAVINSDVGALRRADRQLAEIDDRHDALFADPPRRPHARRAVTGPFAA